MHLDAANTAVQIDPFVNFKGLEFFGMYEMANGNRPSRSYLEEERLLLNM